MGNLLSKGKTRTEALRLLRRRLSDRVYAALLADEEATTQPASTPSTNSAKVRQELADLQLVPAA